MTQETLPQASLAVAILAAGKGTRMNSDLPKAMHILAGKPLFRHVLDTALALQPARIVAVIGPDMDMLARQAHPHDVVVQKEPLGTGHAASTAMNALAGFSGDILILYGDTPLITSESLARLLSRRRENDAAIAVMGMRPNDPARYGRLITDSKGNLLKITEYADASDNERAISFCNSGIMAADARLLPDLLSTLSPRNNKGEYYLTDCVELARKAGHACIAVEGDVSELSGINTRSELATAESLLQNRLRQAAMTAGVTMPSPETVFLCADTRFGRDIVIGPHVVFGPSAIVGDNVEILSFSHIEGTTIEKGARIGPFARLRPGSMVGENAHVGNFVELKNTTLAPGAKANHLTYLGDCTVGSKTNIGAGTITCNYDGYLKHKTIIGAGAFIGSDVALVAPVTVGDGAIIGAGSVITHDIPADAIAIARSRQEILAGRAPGFRAVKAEEKQRKLAKSRAEG
ncbi:MAG TPA: bifunctional UDP-N-acetylglucosamine diphosphorylase/glucosamine-1-phosphate N-acetyltransferase GlmU [Rhodospirillaceae bacterium]|nr:MAG: UDP-N-acetylglucosamine diphosphorylase/glucosamine-1-phosphate N-acetyltransferase [Alphaproteobacteria bacterium GWF2_58_20]HAU29316.1 bifunctional UDP-N-acetylglucosamine diphosphorylase/glucosamine-1-phosphate N-acetyltransferase GlmU [Rhodospirillaceae bacterium]